MEISKEEIKHLANLSALEFEEKEIEKLQKEFNQILDFVNQINNAKVDGDIEYTIHEFVSRFVDAITSTMSYCGTKTLQEFIGKVQITRQSRY